MGKVKFAMPHNADCEKGGGGSWYEARESKAEDAESGASSLHALDVER
jgi:hypothetical protein